MLIVEPLALNMKVKLELEPFLKPVVSFFLQMFFHAGHVKF